MRDEFGLTLSIIQLKFGKVYCIIQSNQMENKKQKCELLFDINLLMSQLQFKGQISIYHISHLIQQVSSIVENQSNLVKLKSPITVVGDIHGQFYDLMNIFRKYDNPSNKQFIFLGDYVDRGTFNIEVITLLLAYKLKYPHSIHLLRGNHQSRSMTSAYNFRQECLVKYNQTIYDDFMMLFDKFPLAAIVDCKFFIAHGGISPSCRLVEDIQKLDRFKEVPESGGVCDLLWSDPSNEISEKWEENDVRKCSYFFGINQAKSFLSQNKLKMIIRAHQVQHQGFKYQKYLNIPLSLTIFSAPNYAGKNRNKGSIAVIEQQWARVKVFSQVEHPVILPNFMNVFQWTIPFLGKCINRMFLSFLKIESSKMSKNLQQIISSKDSFEKDYENMNQAILINKILSLPIDLQPNLSIKEDDLDHQNRQIIIQTFKVEIAKVIGPKLSNSFQSIALFGTDEDNIDFYQ